jgi:hypothetical protein
MQSSMRGKRLRAGGAWAGGLRGFCGGTPYPRPVGRSVPVLPPMRRLPGKRTYAETRFQSPF